MKTITLSALLGLSTLTGGLALAPAPASAACFADPSFPDGTNCPTFNPDTDSVVTNQFIGFNLATANQLQMGFRTDSSSPVTIKNVAWSQDNLSWTNFLNTPLLANSDTTFAVTKAYVLPSGVFASATPSTPFYTRFTIDGSGIAIGDIVESTLFARNSSVTPADDVPLSSPLGSRYFQAARDQQAGVPGPLPLLGAGMAFGMSRRLRRRVSAGASV